MSENIPPGPNPPERIYVRIEIPSGSKVKYEYDKDFKVILVDRILHSSVVYPAAYGFIPQTLCKDGDPLDVLVPLSSGIELIPGCILIARPVAVLNMKDEKGEDDKIIAVPTDDPRMDEIQSMSSIPKHLRREIEEFFDTYKHLERGKTTKIVGWADKGEAQRIITKAINLYIQKND
ncbi:MAG: inorganic diphosphatase [Candidatus Heimdallarchaeota archaeon]|nr:MAG: inorganic diphosphatase [Candidatus Heimdallarchaeota archaeon]